MTETIANAPSSGADASPSPMQRAYFAHMSLPVRDREEAVRFFVNVLGAEVVLDLPVFTEVRMAGTIIGLSQQKGGWTAPDAEYPHYAFEVPPEDFEPLKARLEAHGVKTHPIWTRSRVEALMYFRDPSGNLFEFYCTEGFPNADKLPVSKKEGGDFLPPIDQLSYEWTG